MSYANNNGVFPPPNYISTIDLTQENHQEFTKYFNYTVFNFTKSFSNPLILPFDILIDVICHGEIDIGTSKFTCPLFTIKQVYGNKFHITGPGTAYFWYRYGSIEPASFEFIAKTAINNKDWIILDAMLHTRSFIEAINFIVNNPQSMSIFAKGLDWQLNEIGAKDFFAYLIKGYYDTRKVAQFLTIIAYIDPSILSKFKIPIYNYENPNKTFEAYLDYLPASCCQSISNCVPTSCSQPNCNESTCYPNNTQSCGSRSM